MAVGLAFEEHPITRPCGAGKSIAVRGDGSVYCSNDEKFEGLKEGTLFSNQNLPSYSEASQLRTSIFGIGYIKLS